LWKAGGRPFLKTFFIDNNFSRFASGKTDHQHPFYFYVGSFLADFLPWTPFCLVAFYRYSIKEKFRAASPQIQFLLLWFGLMFLFLSVSHSKRSMYLLPAFPAAALLTAAWLEETGRWRLFRILFSVFACVIVGADVLFIRRLEKDKSFLPVIEAVKQNGGREMLVGYQFSEMERGVFSFYFEGTVKTFEDTVSLQKYLDENKEKRILLLTNQNKVAGLEPALQKRMDVVFKFRENKKTRAYFIYSNFSRDWTLANNRSFVKGLLR
jgi:hypothetical protein